MKEQWQELKEIIIEMRDNDGEATQQEVCKFLANYMDVLEKQMQEPCDDAIIRYVVKEQMIKYGFNAPDMTVTEFVENLPPVIPQQIRWIPVSERLPEVMDGTNGECSDDVLICVAYEENITISTGFYGYYPCSQSEQGWWCVWAHGCEQLDNKCEVLAWMPLPSSYQE